MFVSLHSLFFFRTPYILDTIGLGCFVLKKESIHIYIFDFQLSASNDQRVTLTSVHRQLTGLYMCEVSADAPLFHTEIQMTKLEIVGESISII